MCQVSSYPDQDHDEGSINLSISVPINNDTFELSDKIMDEAIDELIDEL